MSQDLRSPAAAVLKAGLFYFAVAFSAGFVLGTVRVLWLAPRLGARNAELLEMPVMLGISFAAAVYLVRRLALAPRVRLRLGMGGVALGLMLAAEFALVAPLRGISMAEYAADVDAVASPAYYAALALFAVWPLFARPAVRLGPRIGLAAAALAVALPVGLTLETYRHDLGLERMRVAVGSRSVETPCGPIEYAVRGNGPAILVVHGAGGGYDQGLDLAEPLADAGFRVVAPSRFGYLGTPLPPDASPAAQADAHACLLEALGIERAAVVGVSAGAPSAMQLALRHPQRVGALALLVPLTYAPREEGAPTEVVSGTARFMRESAARSSALYWLAMKISPATLTRTILGTPVEVLEHAAASEKERVERTMRHILPLRERQAGLLNDARIAQSLPRYELEKISAPTLVISAADDGYGTYAGSRYTAAHIPGALFIGYGSGGHLSVGHSEEILAAFRTFFGGGMTPLAAAGAPAQSEGTGRALP